MISADHSCAFPMDQTKVQDLRHAVKCSKMPRKTKAAPGVPAPLRRLGGHCIICSSAVAVSFYHGPASHDTGTFDEISESAKKKKKWRKKKKKKSKTQAKTSLSGSGRSYIRNRS